MIEIPLTQGKVALIDDEDAERVCGFKWTLFNNASRRTMYARRTIHVDGRAHSIWLHRFVLNAPKGLQVDHVNMDGLDNRRDNLRLATNSQNHQNARTGSNNVSGFKGVFWCNTTRRWVAQIHLNGKLKRLGSFREKEIAAKVYDLAAFRHFGEFAHLNLPDEFDPNWEPERPAHSSRFRGVFWNKRQRVWMARVHASDKCVWQGVFSSELEAAIQRDVKAREIQGDRAVLNFPDVRAA